MAQQATYMPASAGEPTATNSSLVNAERIRRRRRAERIWSLTPIFTFLALILVWGAAVSLLKISSYLLPGPMAVGERLVSSAPEIWSNTVVTLWEIVLGFAITIILAVPLGLLIALSKAAKRILYPIIMVMQLVPKIAVAPLFLVWMGFGLESKVLLTVLMTFFPLLIASITGFEILDQRLLYLTKSMGASSWQTFRHLRFPAALPVIFSGLKTTATIAATAAIVAEFVGSNSGLGYLLLQGTSTLDTPIIFAVLFVLTLIGILLNYAVELVEWLLTPWQRAQAK